MIDPSDLPCVDFTQSDTIRLISTAYIDEPAMTPLADDDDELSFLEEIEGLTSARQASGIPLPSGLHPTELLTERDGYGSSYANAAFCYTRASGNRFNGPERGAWYAAWGEGAADTALAEVSWHLTRELEATGIFDNVTRYRELIAGFVSRFHDLRGHEGIEALAADPAIAYPAGQALAKAILQDDGNGVLYPSARQSGGICLAAFRPRLVQNVRQGNTWELNWNSKSSPEIAMI